jgi:ribosomal protein L11 methyltransferase
MNYLVYHFNVEPVQPGTDVLIALLGELPFESFVITQNGFDAFIKEEDVMEEFVPELDEATFTYSYTIEKIEQQNWNAEWESNFNPVIVEDKCMIRASFHAAPNASMLDIIIDPKMSFGTGHHDTTWLMARELFSLDLKNKTILDMGCGTGVLAIIASKLGAAIISGIDIDEWSIENSNENALNNRCNLIDFQKGNVTLLEGKKFDIILANINRNVLLNDMEAYYTCLNDNGLLLLSGFFENDFNELNQKALSLNYLFEKKEIKNNWCLLKYSKNSV